MTTSTGTDLSGVDVSELSTRWEGVPIWVGWTLILGYVAAFWYGVAWGVDALWRALTG